MAAKSRTMAQQKTKEAYCFIVPAFIYMILVLGYPIVYNIILSLKDVNVKNLKSGTSVFVGLQNYIDLFHDPTFLLVLRNTFIFTIACLIFQFTIGFAFAMFFNQKFKLAGPIRGLILVSYMMPMAVTGLLGKNIFSNAGLINDLLGKIGISGPEWLVNTSTALIAVIIMNCWVGIPFNMLLLVSGLTSISPDVYESASMDGANWGQRFLFITLPLMKESILAVLMLGFMNAEALQKTQELGKVTFFSRTKNRLWTKGEESGNFLLVDSIKEDCDRDTLLIKVRPVGPVCHTGSDTCFDEKNVEDIMFLKYLQDFIDRRKQEMPEGSYTTSLFNKGINRMAQKVGEEAVETVIEATNGTDDRLIYEASDLIYHLIVLLTSKGYRIEDLARELQSRHKE